MIFDSSSSEPEANIRSASPTSVRVIRPEGNDHSKHGSHFRKIAKPSNSFLLFRNEWHCKIQETHPHLPNGERSKLIATRWKTISPEEKRYYKTKAQTLLCKYYNDIGREEYARQKLGKYRERLGQLSDSGIRQLLFEKWAQLPEQKRNFFVSLAKKAMQSLSREVTDDKRARKRRAKNMAGPSDGSLSRDSQQAPADADSDLPDDLKGVFGTVAFHSMEHSFAAAGDFCSTDEESGVLDRNMDALVPI